MKWLTSTMTAVVVSVALAGAGQAQVVEKKALTLEGAQQDEEIAQAGAAAAKTLKLGMTGTALSRKVTFIDCQMVAAGFAKGKVLVTVGNYMVHASHREMDGIAEIHTLDTDLIYMLEG